MPDERSIEGLIMTLDVCEHYLPKSLPPIHRQHLRRIRRMLRELAGTIPHDTDSPVQPRQITRDDHDS